MTFTLQSSDQSPPELTLSVDVDRWFDSGPVEYSGNESLLPVHPKFSSPAYLDRIFSDAAYKHGLVVGGTAGQFRPWP